MSKHPSHDWSPITGYCLECCCYCMALEADHPCKPSTDDSPEAMPDLDWSEITRAFST